MLLLRTAVVVALSSVLVSLSAQPAAGAEIQAQVRRRAGLAENGSEVDGRLGKRWFFFDGGSLSPVGQRAQPTPGHGLPADSPSTPSDPADPTTQDPGTGVPDQAPQDPKVGSSDPTKKDSTAGSSIPTQQDPKVGSSSPDQQGTNTVVPVSSGDMHKAAPASKCRFQKKLDRLGDPNAQVSSVQISSRDIKSQQDGRVISNA